METRFTETMPDHKYSILWKKYRPALLSMMIACEVEPQQYKLFVHEFQAFDQKKKNFSFTLQVYRGKATNNIKASMAAIDLLNMLTMSNKAIQLMNERAYQFSLDKEFVLHVSRIEAPI